MDEIPKNFADLMRHPARVREAFSLLRQLKNLKVVQNNGQPATLKLFPGALDTVLDLRDNTPSGTAISPPATAGGPGQFTWMKCSAEQSIASSTTTAVSFDTEYSNTFGLWAAASPTRFVVPAGQGGVWLFNGVVSFVTANSTGTRAMTINKNGAQTTGGIQVPAASLSSLSASAFAICSPEDYVELVAFQDSGSALSITGAMQAIRLCDIVAFYSPPVGG